MRLLDTRTLELVEFMDDAIPDYAILSHRWQAATDEVSFSDLQNGQAKNKQGFKKLKYSCLLACEQNIAFVWIDTCCIDKSSSAELSEAINSMFRYYQEAEVCFVYLFDVDSTKGRNMDLALSSWFTRSWTLQELLAPRDVEFYDREWRKFGTKNLLAEEISRITGIDRFLLSDHSTSSLSVLRRFSIATKMSWASSRIASRKEDVAYSLLGIFEVNMPLLYGEGNRAFVRLQEEIMKHSDDHTLFAWSSSAICQRGLLAKSPSDFSGCANVFSIPKLHSLHRAPYSVTNMGLSIELLMIPWSMDTYFAALDATNSADRIGIYLQHLEEDGQYARVSLNGDDFAVFPHELISKGHMRKIYVRQFVWDIPHDKKLYGFWLRGIPTNHHILKVAARNAWDSELRFLEIPLGQQGTAGVIWFKSGMECSVLKLGFDDDFNARVYMQGPLWVQDGLGIQVIVPDPEGTPIEQSLDTNWMVRWLDCGEESKIQRIPRALGVMIHRPHANLSLWEEEVAGSKIWVVDITETDGGALNRTLNRLMSSRNHTICSD